MNQNSYQGQMPVLREIRRRHRHNLPCDAGGVRSGNQSDTLLYMAALKFWGSWRAALEEAETNYGVILSRVDKSYPTPDKVLQGIRHRYQAGLSLRAPDLRRSGSRGNAKLIKRAVDEFGSWRHAVDEAALEGVKKGGASGGKYSSPDQVVQEIQRRFKKGMSIRSSYLIKEPTKDISLLHYGKKFFGTWSHALDAAGVTLSLRTSPKEKAQRKSIQQKRLIILIQYLHTHKFPLDAYTMAHAPPDIRNIWTSGRKRFGSWKEAIEAAGLDYKKISKNRNMR